MLRAILGSYLGVPGHDVVVTTQQWGKPIVASPLHPEIQFNMSHAADVGLVAIGIGPGVGGGVGGGVGVDIESIEHSPDWNGLLDLALSPDERMHVLSLPPANRQAAFLTYWTQKEAYLKGIGVGLKPHPGELAVVSGPDRSARIQTSGRIGPDADWIVTPLPAPMEGYVAALATNTVVREIVLRACSAA